MANELTKQAVAHLRSGDKDMFKQAFDSAGKDYLRRYVREDSFAEKILDVKTVTVDSDKVQKDIDSDTFYYLDEIEHGATAMQVSIRGDQKPRFIDGERYAIRIGKLETDPVKKKELELLVTSYVLDMIKTNGAEALRRAQDQAFLSPLWEIAKADTDGSHTVTADWSGGPTKDVFVDGKGIILGKELLPKKWLMAETTWNEIHKLDATEIGDMAGEIMFNGLPKRTLLELPVVTSVKSKLRSFGGDSMFYNKATGKHYVYLFVDSSFIGRLVKFEDAHIWSKWEADLFTWKSWLYRGMGIGDIRGFVRMEISLT